MQYIKYCSSHGLLYHLVPYHTRCTYCTGYTVPYKYAVSYLTDTWYASPSRIESRTDIVIGQYQYRVWYPDCKPQQQQQLEQVISGYGSGGGAKNNNTNKNNMLFAGYASPLFCNLGIESMLKCNAFLLLEPQFKFEARLHLVSYQNFVSFFSFLYVSGISCINKRLFLDCFNMFMCL